MPYIVKVVQYGNIKKLINSNEKLINELMDDNNYIIIHKKYTDKKIWIGFEYKYKNYNIYINNKLGIKQIIIMDEYSLDNIIINEYLLNN